MGRGRNQKRQMMRMDVMDYDTSSTSSTATSSDFAVTIQDMEDERDEDSTLSAFIESLYEKRAKTREEGFKGLINALKSNVLIDFVESNYETLLHLCIGSIKKGGGSEIIIASQLIGLISITSGAGDIAQRVFSEASPHLLKIAKLGSESRARMAALEALAVTCFIDGMDCVAIEDVMAMLFQISKHKGNNHADQTLGMCKPSSEVRAASLSAWTFLLTIIPSSRIMMFHMPQSLPTLSALLESEDQNVRKSAGEAAGVLFETKAILDSGYNLSQKEDNLVEQIRGLSLEAGGKGQANKKAQRSLFREILSILEGGAVSGISIKLKYGDVLSLDSWTPMVQYRFFSHMLGEGLQRHLQENSLLHEIFSFVPKQEKKLMSVKEKRMYLSPNSISSKARTQNMNRRRSQAHARQGHYGMNENDGD